MSAAGLHVAPAPAPVGGRLVTPFTAILALLVALMGAVIAVRVFRGIGAVTNLNDGYPWGVWIGWDVAVGSAVGASGMTVAFATYILNRGEYHPIVRPALLTALFGSMTAGLSVLFDLGRWWDMWHIFMPRYAQLNSVLLVVSLCLTAYILVLILEVSPAVLERLGMQRTRKQVDRVLFVLVAIGLVLSTMHQSSLGTVLIVFGPQVDPLYQTNLLPILFLTSTIGMGLAAVTIEGSVTALALRRPLERDLLAGLMKVSQALTVIFLALRFGDLAYRGVLPRLLELRTVTVMFWIETLCFAAPVVLLAGPGSRRPRRFFIAAMLLAIAGTLYRLDAYLVAYHTGPGWTYFPSMGELVVTIGLVAFEILAFIIAIRILPVLSRSRGARHGQAHRH